LINLRDDSKTEVQQAARAALKMIDPEAVEKAGFE